MSFWVSSILKAGMSMILSAGAVSSRNASSHYRCLTVGRLWPVKPSAGLTPRIAMATHGGHFVRSSPPVRLRRDFARSSRGARPDPRSDDGLSQARSRAGRFYSTTTVAAGPASRPDTSNSELDVNEITLYPAWTMRICESAGGGGGGGHADRQRPLGANRSDAECAAQIMPGPIGPRSTRLYRRQSAWGQAPGIELKPGTQNKWPG